jgi:hypothetical protein
MPEIEDNFAMLPRRQNNWVTPERLIGVYPSALAETTIDLLGTANSKCPRTSEKTST